MYIDDSLNATIKAMHSHDMACKMSESDLRDHVKWPSRRHKVVAC
jgi:hypothetical protein